MTIQSDYLLALTNDMASRSLGFRSRLGQIGSSPYFRGTLRFVWRTLSPSAIAQTNFARTKAGWLFADIQIPARLVFVRQDVEMIAHEIEHVIEQIEGLDLKTLTSTHPSLEQRLEQLSKVAAELGRPMDGGFAPPQV